MGRCIYSHDDGAYCDKHDHGAVTVGCCGEDKCRDRKALSNADRIRSMTDEELDGFLNEVQGDAYLVGFYARAESRFTPYGKRWLDWLRQEANDET